MYIDQAVEYLNKGCIIAYPTEAVFGLGCDPKHEAAVMRLLSIKQRAKEKGLILIASELQQLFAYIDEKLFRQYPAACESWPGPHTWVFPCRSGTPDCLSGCYNTLAVRLTSHPIAAELCNAYGGAIVSTSANKSSQTPAKTAAEVRSIFHDEIDFIVEGEIGSSETVTTIKDAASGNIIRG